MTELARRRVRSSIFNPGFQVNVVMSNILKTFPIFVLTYKSLNFLEIVESKLMRSHYHKDEEQHLKIVSSHFGDFLVIFSSPSYFKFTLPAVGMNEPLSSLSILLSKPNGAPLTIIY